MKSGGFSPPIPEEIEDNPELATLTILDDDLGSKLGSKVGSQSQYFIIVFDLGTCEVFCIITPAMGSQGMYHHYPRWMTETGIQAHVGFNRVV